MGIIDYFAGQMVEEWKKEGNDLSFELARLIVQADTCESTIKLLMHSPELTVKKLADGLGVSVRFVKISMSRYRKGKRKPPKSMALIWEQLLEMRKIDDPECKWSEERRENKKKDSRVILAEQLRIITDFLTETNYSVGKVARLVGVSITCVEIVKKHLLSKQQVKKTMTLKVKGLKE